MPIDLQQFRKKISDPPITPDWATSETTVKLYAATISLYDEIKSKLESKTNIAQSERKLISRRIALHCGFSPSIITTRRQPNIVNLIGDLNADLALIYQSSQAKKWSSGRKLTKEELIQENKSLKAENAKLRTLALGDYALKILESSFSVDSRNHAISIAKLREEIARQDIVIANQAEQNRQYMEALSQYIQ